MRRRLLAVVPVGFVVGLALLTAQGVPAAQEATPPGEAPPLTLELLGSVPSTDAPGMQLHLLRVTIAPGAAAPPHMHAGQLVVAIESGTAAYTILDEGAETGRGGFGTPTATDVITAGTEVMLSQGEWFLEEPGVVHTVRNPGDAPLVLLISALVAADQPILQPMEMDMATPTA